MKKGNKQGFADRLFRARLAYAAHEGRKISQADIADAVGVAQGTVTKWESGDAEPSLTTIIKLAKYLAVDPGYLAFGDASKAIGLPGFVTLRELDKRAHVREVRERLDPEREADVDLLVEEPGRFKKMRADRATGKVRRVPTQAVEADGSVAKRKARRRKHG